MAIEEMEADEVIRRWIYSKNQDNQLDVDQRRFVWIMCRSLLKRDFSIPQVEKYNNSFFWRKDHTHSNPYNNWFLRFPETCPSFVFQQLSTNTGVHDLIAASRIVPFPADSNFSPEIEKEDIAGKSSAKVWQGGCWRRDGL